MSKVCVCVCGADLPMTCRLCVVGESGCGGGEGESVSVLGGADLPSRGSRERGAGFICACASLPSKGLKVCVCGRARA